MKQILSFIVSLVAIALPLCAQEYKQLNELEVIASNIINDSEGYTINLSGKDIVKGKSAEELLPFLPSISKEDEILKINGQPVGEIYIDGLKLSDNSELRNIPGELLNKIHVKYLAGADKEASINGGVIFITLRRPPEYGYYGSLTAGTDWFRSSGFGNGKVGGLINYRHKNLSIYDNLNLRKLKLRENTDQQIIEDALSTQLSDIIATDGFEVRNRLSITKHFNSGASLGGCYHIAASEMKPSASSIKDNTTDVVDQVKKASLHQATLKFALPLNSNGASMELTSDYLYRNRNEKSSYWTGKDMVGETLDKGKVDLWKFKADFKFPLSRNISLGVGSSIQWITSDLTPYQSMTTDRFEVSSVATRTTGLTPIVYATAQGRLWKLRYSAGINWQLNSISYLDKSVDVKNRNTQWAINPTLQVMMPFGSMMQHALMVNYKRTLSDIPYSAISSVADWKNPYNYVIGNPDLKAQSADMVTAGLALLRNKIGITAVYGRSHDRIFWQTFMNPDIPDVFYTKPINISGQNVWGLGAEWMESPLPWWKFKLSARIEITPENTELGNTFYRKTQCREYFSFNNSFQWANNWGGMLNVHIEPTFTTLDRTYHSVYGVTGQIYKAVLKNRLRIALEFTPIGKNRTLDRRVGDYKVTYRSKTPIQHIGLSVVWNFSGGKKVRVDVVEGIQGYDELNDDIQ